MFNNIPTECMFNNIPTECNFNIIKYLDTKSLNNLYTINKKKERDRIIDINNLQYIEHIITSNNNDIKFHNTKKFILLFKIIREII